MADIEVEVNDGILVATLNRPEKMNSLSAELTSGLIGAIKRASEDDDVRVMVLTGNGRAFCAGAEVSAERAPAGVGSAGATGTGPARSRYDRMNGRAGSAEAALAFANSDVPIIGAINGVAAGGGFGIALCCDVRIFAESARIGSIFIKRGVAADYGAAYWLPRIVGVSKAFELFYDGNVIDSARALELGLANRVVPDDQLMDEVMAYAAKIAAGPPMGYTGVRRLILESVDNIERGMFLDREWMAQAQLLKTNDAGEGFSSFIERRDPEFTGT
ncbi:MAG: enoyl-CoA hydratase-related protein [Chloroflexi bacterium]|nr:enoyl-CoA hydratase-related protein [Chloroflexota bacterium]MDA1146281.1 enoyl-CoA hydratase-related protein [Chloroflexota bacterium]